MFYREGHAPRLSETQLSANQRHADNGIASPPTNEEGQAFIKSIDARYRTVLRVAEAVVNRERGFLDNGPEHIRGQEPSDIANDRGLHVMTVQQAAS